MLPITLTQLWNTREKERGHERKETHRTKNRVTVVARGMSDTDWIDVKLEHSGDARMRFEFLFVVCNAKLVRM